MEMRAEQREAAEWLSTRTEAIVPAAIGWGKTIVTLTAIEKIRQIYGPWRTLVVSTRNIIEHTWPDEIRKWPHLRHLTYASAVGRNREAVLARPDVLGLNFENLVWFYDLVDADPTLRPEILVIDESHHMKSFSANRVKRHVGWKPKNAERKPGHVAHYKRRFALTGTPNPEGYADLYTQECSISSRRRLGANITMFRRLMCRENWVGTRAQYTVDRIGEQRIERALAPITFKASLNRYLDTPAPVFSTRWVPWAPGARDEYEDLERDFVLDLRQKLRTADPDANLEGMTIDELIMAGIDHALAPNAGVLMSKLRQARSGFVYDPNSNARLLTDSEAMLDALEGVVEDAAGVPLLVFTQYQAEDEMIAQRFPQALIGMPRSLKDWDAHRIPMLCVHPESAGEGLNLQHGTHICVYYNMPWSYGLWKQSWGRVDRGGQTRQVSVIRLARPDSVDDYVWTKIILKGAKVDKFLTNVTGE